LAKPTDLVQGTLGLLILKTLALQPMHGWGIAQRIRQVSKEVLQVNQGALYPALASPRTTGLDPRQMGRIGKQSPRQVLFTHTRRAQSICSRSTHNGSGFLWPLSWC